MKPEMLILWVRRLLLWLWLTICESMFTVHTLLFLQENIDNGYFTTLDKHTKTLVHFYHGL